MPPPHTAPPHADPPAQTSPPAPAGPTPIAVARPRREREGWYARWAALGQRLPAAVLAASLLLTLAATVFAARIGRARAAAQFENAVQAATDRILARTEAYETLLDGVAAFFAANEAEGDEVTSADFRAYVARLDLERRFPGVRGIGYSAVLWRAGSSGAGSASFDSARALAAMRARGSFAPRLWPGLADRPRAEVHGILFIEPTDARNRAALGFDMHADSVRRAAMDRARDTGLATASGRVRLVQEITRATQPGFLVYVPVYRGGGIPATVDARRRALAGFVYAPFRTGDLLRGIFGSERQPRVAFRIFDGADTTTAPLLADSRALDGLPSHGAGAPLPARHLEQLDVAGRRWTIVFAPLAGPRFGGSDAAAVAVGAFGVLVSVALALAAAAEVRARERVEQSDLLRGRFFAAMSHELRTPINAVLGYNDLLLAGIYGDLGDPQRDGIQRSQRAARHLLELVNDVLDLSKLEAGKVDVQSEPVPLNALLDDLSVTIGPLAAERGCALEVDARACGVVLHTDPRRLRQILLNLLSNATKFGAGRPVRVWCDRRAGDGGRDGSFVAVHVRDEGPGIAPADQARVFEEFVQLPGSTPGGTGLGLPISRRLAELLGGTLTVQSAAGAGSTFTVRLPASAPQRS